MLNNNIIYWKVNGGMRGRIVNEIGNLMFQCDSVKFEIINDEYCINIINNNNKYRVILSKDYPFRIPISVEINNKNYKSILCMNEPKINNYLIKLYGKQCLCCSSLMCADNWIPTFNISYIINEINNTLKIKKEIFLNILCDTIKVKYNLEFLNIIDYLI
jgi:hypothetical protein